MDYSFCLTGLTPILIHADDVMAGDALKEWRSARENKNISVAGDDRSPPWTWQTYLYSDGQNLVIPQENIMACLRNAGMRITVPGKKNKTLKEVTQTGLMIDTETCNLLCGGKHIPISAITAIRDLGFAEQFQAVKKLGFELKVKRAKVGTSKHVRVRAMLKSWKVTGTIMTADPIFDAKMLSEIFYIAGHYIGLLDWRPNSPKSPGPYGRFLAELTPIENAA
jgi:hypothetical protein